MGVNSHTWYVIRVISNDEVTGSYPVDGTILGKMYIFILLLMSLIIFSQSHLLS